jgi:hypothetical protein
MSRSRKTTVVVGAAFVLLVGCGLALLAAGWGSNNKDSIVGKWKTADSDRTAVVFEFTADGQFIATTEGEPGDKAEPPVVIRGHYSLGTGHWVTLSDVAPPLDGKTHSREHIVIRGDTMTIDDDGTAQTFTRVK